MMRLTCTCRNIVVNFYLLVCLLSSGCSLLEGNQDPLRMNYRSTSSNISSPLEVPPNLVNPAHNDGIYSVMPAHNTQPTDPESISVQVEIRGSGTYHYLFVKKPPQEIWPLLRPFWEGQGFSIAREETQIGLIETDWAEDRAKFNDGPIRSVLGNLLGMVYSTGQRDRFRTQIEKSGEGTEIFITHRGLIEVFTNKHQDRTVWQPRSNDPSLELEFLRRLLQKMNIDPNNLDFSKRPEKLKEKYLIEKSFNLPRNDKSPLYSVTLHELGTTKAFIRVTGQFSAVWKDVGFELRKNWFTVEKTDKEKATYTFRYLDTDASIKEDEKAKPNFFSRIFNTEPSIKVPQRLQLKLKEESGSVLITVLSDTGETLSSQQQDTVERILRLIQEKLSQKTMQ